MKLYYSTGACSLSPHIVLREAGFPFELERVNLASKKTAADEDYLAVNPKGYVPALKLDSGDVLTEGPAIVQYLADKAPEKQLAPAAGTMERYRLVEWLNFISTELHKQFSPLFKPNTPEETKEAARNTISTRLNIVDKQLQGRDYLTGNQFSVADAYLFTVLNWARPMKFDLGQWPAVETYMQRVAARPAVQEAMKAEGLLKE
ncbi:glutathione transferase GstA [Noviherbaspirillum denitrificans]|uniref:Glutathione S-transferase n=1 Tax=Noviherbaspirillum denitrificans TaxID=1968433 RepID=A0A254TEP5_9BURK|nr:glutathione transferase GstA [Noviherbaspirillum denitrificans]OWW21111.1 glutathione S-transferase [Noviherbaspirillum denitrificans]